VDTETKLREQRTAFFFWAQETNAYAGRVADEHCLSFPENQSDQKKPDVDNEAPRVGSAVAMTMGEYHLTLPDS